MKDQTRVCRVCRKKFNIQIHTRTTESNEGILFRYGPRVSVWFCNDCWKEIIKYYLKWKKNKSI